MSWATPKYNYGERVRIKPLEDAEGRVMDLHSYGQLGSIEYDVRYFHEGKDYKVRLFEDEIEGITDAR